MKQTIVHDMLVNPSSCHKQQYYYGTYQMKKQQECIRQKDWWRILLNHQCIGLKGVFHDTDRLHYQHAHVTEEDILNLLISRKSSRLY